MPRTIQCDQCGVVLNLPDQAVGRRLKCPRCGAKFQAGGTPPAGGGPTTKPGATGGAQGPDTTFELSKKASSNDLPVMPRADGDLRETFDLPMMTEAAGSTGARPPGKGGREAADALALFDERPTAPRRKAAAEARSQARRCPTCGGYVPVGMSICQTCGLDLETGMRVGLEDDLAPPPAARSDGPPLPLMIVGGLCAAVSAAMAVLALVLSQQDVPGALYFLPVAGFGVYASVQFLRGKSVKLLLIALTLGAMIDLAALVVLPVWNAQQDVVTQEVREPGDDPDRADIEIRSVSERLDQQRLSAGFTILFLYGVLSIYLLSTPVQKHFRR